MADLPDFSQIEGFDWDRGNSQKNWDRHRVAFFECEEVFFHGPIVLPNPKHSAAEVRYYAFGGTTRRRLLTIIFTLRRNKIRVISARDMSRRERRFYAKEIQRSP